MIKIYRLAFTHYSLKWKFVWPLLPLLLPLNRYFPFLSFQFVTNENKFKKICCVKSICQKKVLNSRSTVAANIRNTFPIFYQISWEVDEKELKKWKWERYKIFSLWINIWLMGFACYFTWCASLTKVSL
jgi:hypothetical protein